MPNDNHINSNNNSNNNNNNKNNNNHNNNNNNQFSLYPVTDDEVQESIKGINGGLNEFFIFPYSDS